LKNNVLYPDLWDILIKAIGGCLKQFEPRKDVCMDTISSVSLLTDILTGGFRMGKPIHM